MSQSSNKTIAKNTLFLFFRTLLIMGISLYTSRVVLAELGVEDYDILHIFYLSPETFDLVRFAKQKGVKILNINPKEI